MRQKIPGKYIADFYCVRAKLVIELDGSQHYQNGSAAYDAQRDAFLSRYGLTVLRIPNNALTQNLRGVCEQIDHMVRQACGD